MFDALQWVEQIRSVLRPLEKQILGHSYLKALEEGRLQHDQLRSSPCSSTRSSAAICTASH